MAELNATGSKTKMWRCVENKLEAELNASAKTKYEGKQRQPGIGNNKTEAKSNIKGVNEDGVYLETDIGEGVENGTTNH